MIRAIFSLAQYRYAFPAWPPFIVGFSIFALSLAVTVRERFSQISNAFSFLCWSAVVWLVGCGLMYSSIYPDMAFRWARVDHVGVAFIPSTLFYFTLILVKRHLRHSGLIRTAFAASAIFAYMSLTSRQWIVDLQTFEWGHYPAFGPGGALFLAFFYSFSRQSFSHLARLSPVPGQRSASSA